MIVEDSRVKRPMLKSSLLLVSNFAGSALPGVLPAIERLANKDRSIGAARVNR